MIKKRSEQINEIRKNMRGGPKEVAIRHHLNKDEMNAKCRLCAELVLVPGAGIGMHDHTNEDEVFIIQKGRGTVIDDGKEYDIEAGDVMLTGKGASHSITNNGKDDLVITAIIMQY